MASSSSAKQSNNKLRILLVPFFASSHIGPYADLAVRLATARPGAVEPTVAVTPANVPVVRSALERHGAAASVLVKVATYPFPLVDGLAPGVENLSTAGDDAWRIDAAALDEALTRPAQEALLRERRPDAVVTDYHFFWNCGIAGELGVPCVAFSVIGPFSLLVMRLLDGTVRDRGSESQVVVVPGLPGPEIQIPVAELPEFLTRQANADDTRNLARAAALSRCLGVAVNACQDIEQQYCEMYVRAWCLKRGYFVGPVSLPLPLAAAGTGGESPCIGWLGSKPSCSVVYVCFGTYAAISADQLRELALGLEASGKPFLWAVRADRWAPPEGWAERVGERGMLAVAAGVPMLTWPLVFDQFIEERLVTDVLRIGEKVWDGPRSSRYEEREVVPAEAVARSVARFMEPGGAGEAARGRARELAVKAHAAVAEGGSSYRDLHRLIDDLIEARATTGGMTSLSAVPAKMSGNNADGARRAGIVGKKKTFAIICVQH
ncbi:unnamed protein product [Urochloa decumbens]|uniref:Uncharacterized protein n=1 Tax=Urochloa decumbens TaxID=240449 RepID=A0ABC8W4Y1_9POAL